MISILRSGWLAALWLMLCAGSAAALEINTVSTASGLMSFDVVAWGPGVYYLALGDNDPDAARLDIVIMGDGYDASDADQARFANAARVCRSELFEVPPYASFGLCINVWMVSLVSEESGITDKAHGYLAKTALQCSFAEEGVMKIDGDNGSAVLKAATICELVGVPFDKIFVIVNDKFDHDGAYSEPDHTISYVSDLYPWGTVMAHELGHLVASLGDEYRAAACYEHASTADGAECLTSQAMATYTLPWEPMHPNLTTAVNIDTLEWGDLVETKAFPTTIDSVISGTVLGRWEGGGECCFGIYRPREYCLMDGVTGHNPATDTFCAVCSRAIVDSLLAHYGCPAE
ncbi:MAG TPA: M64 family metallopeptidase [Candidatus Krumholzibacteria bacterium]|nr:M64 family metallopeptidase [Candidatus Krumholzibacteria bacterium]